MKELRSEILLNDILNHKYQKNDLVVYFYSLLNEVNIEKTAGNRYYIVSPSGKRNQIQYKDMKAWFVANQYKFTFNLYK